MGCRLHFLLIIVSKTLQTPAESPARLWIGRIGETRREKLYSIVTLKRQFPSLLALLQCFNRFAASLVSVAHPILFDSDVEEQLVNFFLRWYSGKCAPRAAFGIHRAVHFTQTLEAMFAASITLTAKRGASFIKKYTPQLPCLLCYKRSCWNVGAGVCRSRVLS